VRLTVSSVTGTVTLTMTTASTTRPAAGRVPTTDELRRFAHIQQIAYAAAEAVAGQLEPGMTEREAAHRLTRRLVGDGADDWFHRPFAWFGDRTAFRNFRVPLQFFPTNRRLEEGMPFILDAAPVIAGATADIGYAGCLGDNPALDRVRDDLAAHRAFIVELVRERRTFREVYEAVDRLAAQQGYANRHHAYPGHVIAHEVLPLAESAGVGTVFGFGRRHLRSLGRSIVAGHRQNWSPLWAGDRRSDHAPVNGLWAVEPHLGLRGVGAKFEEYLVVTDDDAFWLDDDLPHVRRWLGRGITDVGAR
jgi:Xaa-Pro aminopeptidase